MIKDSRTFEKNPVKGKKKSQKFAKALQRG
jgi:hypothetical protein